MSEDRSAEGVAASVGLVRTEAWVARDAVLGVVLLGAWLAGTGLAVRAAGDALDPTVARGLLAVAWLLVPGLAVAWRVSAGVTNRHGNVERRYRLERPGVTVALPLGVVAVGLAVGALLGVSHPAAAAVLAVGAVLLVVRTVAYGLRVFTLSWRPLLWLVAGATGVGFAGGLLFAALAVSGRWELVPSAARVAVSPERLAWTVAVGPLSARPVPLGIAAAAVLPSICYLAVQVPASRLARRRSRSIPREKLRAGQRVPSGVQVTTASDVGGGSGTPVADSEGTGGGAGTAAGGRAGASGGDGGAGAGSAGDDGAGAGGTRVFKPGADAPNDGATGGAGTGRAAETGTSGAGGRENRFEDTKVFRAPSPGECPDCGAAVVGDGNYCPECGASLSGTSS